MRASILGLGVAFAGFAFVGVPSALAAFPGADNGLIAFSRYPRTSSAFEEIYTIKPSGRGLTRLTNRNGHVVSSVFPDWNATGTRIAYQRSTVAGSRIHIIKPNGAPVSSFADPACEGGAEMPSWSPNGTTLAYTCPDGDDGIYVKTYDLQSGVRKLITATGGFDSTPEYSPLGGAIAYTGEGVGGTAEVHVAFLEPDGDLDHDELIAGGPNEGASDPDWSPSATELVYTCVDLVGPPFDPDICRAPVASPHTELPVVSGGGFEQYAAFSPSGNQFVWDSGPDDDNTELRRRLLAGGPVTRITADAVVNQQADWGPG